MQFRDVSDDVLLAYVKDDRRSFNRLMLDDAGRYFVQDVMAACSINSKLRERVVAKILKLNHNLDVNGWDAKDIKGRAWEIKTEQRNGPIVGSFKWAYTSDTNLNKYTGQPLVYSPFTPDGKCIFVLGYLVSGTNVINLVKKRKKDVRFTVSSILDRSILYYYNPKYLTDEYLVPAMLDPILEYIEDFEDQIYMR